MNVVLPLVLAVVDVIGVVVVLQFRRVARRSLLSYVKRSKIVQKKLVYSSELNEKSCLSKKKRSNAKCFLFYDNQQISFIWESKLFPPCEYVNDRGRLLHVCGRRRRRGRFMLASMHPYSTILKIGLVTSSCVTTFERIFWRFRTCSCTSRGFNYIQYCTVPCRRGLWQAWHAQK